MTVGMAPAEGFTAHRRLLLARVGHFYAPMDAGLLATGLAPRLIVTARPRLAAPPDSFGVALSFFGASNPRQNVCAGRLSLDLFEVRLTG